MYEPPFFHLIFISVSQRINEVVILIDWLPDGIAVFILFPFVLPELVNVVYAARINNDVLLL